MTTMSAESPTTDRKAVVNFSRPRVNSNATSDPSRSRPTTPSHTTSVDDSHSHAPLQEDDTASNLSFSLDPDPSPASGPDSSYLPSNKVTSTPANDLPRRAPALSTHDQRHPGPPGREYSHSGSSGSSSSTKTAATSNSIKQLMPKSILKQTHVEQYSERADSEAGGEGTGSNRTGSEDIGVGNSNSSNSSSRGSYDENGKWTSSDHDTSMLSEKEIRKLEKKGVNPSLYAEMKAARKGKSCISALTANAYVT